MNDLTHKFADEWNLYWYHSIMKNPQFGYYPFRSNMITSEFILQHPEIDWDWGELSLDENVTIDVIEQYIDKSWNWYYISANPSITMDFATTYPEKDWNWEAIMRHSKISWDCMEKNKNDNCPKWDMNIVNCNSTVTLDEIIQHPDYFWNLFELSHNPNLTLDFILSKDDPSKWNWHVISMHKNITIDMILNHPECPWHWLGIFQNPNITLQMMLDNHDKIRDFDDKSENIQSIIPIIDWDLLSCNPSITPNDILAHKDEDWDWEMLSKNKNITISVVNELFDKPWDFDYLTENPNITINDIATNPDIPWEIDWICYNTFPIDKQNYIQRNMKNMWILTLHKYYNQPSVCKTITYTNIELVLFDEYLVKMMMEY
jgi:hypothetical protein